ncbi:MAG: OmpA family protein [Gemmatimonadaceae bacterium]|jgi:outer membrane protein OmpA-like peptidoglycan-associated protein|nr:OmpA family protein [Gemmatimonadaceae bacterium]
MSSQLRPVVLAAALLAAAAPAAHGQGLLDRMKRRAEERAKQNLERKVDQAVDCAMGDQACISKAKADGKEVRIDSSAAPKGDGTTPTRADAPADAPPAAVAKAGEGAWANYDFVPGTKVLFHDDFTKDNIGDFPRRLEFVDGTIELVKWNDLPWLSFSSTGKANVPVGTVLPARFTMEFDYYGSRGSCWIYPTGSGNDGYFIIEARGGGGFSVQGRSGSAEGGDPGLDKVHQARIMMDGAYAKGYVDGKRVMNVPNFGAARADKILFFCDEGIALGGIRVAEGGRKLYDAIAATGRVATQGIYFDTGSDRIRAESTPTLKEIATMLAEHADLSLVIEGHTDNTGQPAANLALSQRRAAAVVAMLTAQFGVEAARLQARGLGDTRPSAPNTSSEGRQQNRRVELVKRG